jgi:hypothetical protein
MHCFLLHACHHLSQLLAPVSFTSLACLLKAVVFSSPLQVRCGLAYALRLLKGHFNSVCLCEPLVQNTCKTTLQRSINKAVIGTEALTSSAKHNTIYQAISACIRQSVPELGNKCLHNLCSVHVLLVMGKCMTSFCVLPNPA